jgi:hypothetical protein
MREENKRSRLIDCGTGEVSMAQNKNKATLNEYYG